MEIKKINETQILELSKYNLPEEIWLNAVAIKYDKGEYLCREDERLEYLLFLLSGEAKISVSVSNGRILLLNFYRQEGILGDLEMMINKRSTTNVIAMSKVICVGIKINYCKEKLDKNIEFMKCMAIQLAKKLDTCSKNSAINLLHLLENRLCAYIEVASQESVFKENLTEVAELLGTSYRHLLRTMNSLCEIGILEKKSRTTYWVINKEMLTKKAMECY